MKMFGRLIVCLMFMVFTGQGFRVMKYSNVTFDDGFCDWLNDLAGTKGYVLNGQISSLDVARMFLLKAFGSIPSSKFPQWNVTKKVLEDTLQWIKSTPCNTTGSKGFPFKAYIPQMEGPVVAPLSHTIAFKNDLVSVIHWHLDPLYREPFHTHGLASLMYITIPGGDKYYDENGVMVHSRPNVNVSIPYSLDVDVMAPEWLHSVESTDDHTYHVLRIEFVPIGQTYYHWPSSDILG